MLLGRRERRCMEVLRPGRPGARACLKLGSWEARLNGRPSPRCTAHAAAFCQRSRISMPGALEVAWAALQRRQAPPARVQEPLPDRTRIGLLEERLAALEARVNRLEEWAQRATPLVRS